MMERLRQAAERTLGTAQPAPGDGDGDQLDAVRARMARVVEAGQIAAQRAVARHGTRLMRQIRQAGGQ